MPCRVSLALSPATSDPNSQQIRHFWWPAGTQAMRALGIVRSPSAFCCLFTPRSAGV